MQTILDLLSQIDWTQFGGWGLIVAGVLAMFRDKIKKAVPALAGLNPFGAGDVDVADLAAVKQLEARAERRGCPKLANAVSEVEVCFFNKKKVKAEPENAS